MVLASDSIPSGSNSGCLNGQNPTALTNLEGLSGNVLMNQFAEDIVNDENSSQPQQELGGQYIANQIYPDGAKVTLSELEGELDSDWTAKLVTTTWIINSAYSPTKPTSGTIFDGNSSSGYLVRYSDTNSAPLEQIELSQTGGTGYIDVKLDCGNILGNGSPGQLPVKYSVSASESPATVESGDVADFSTTATYLGVPGSESYTWRDYGSYSSSNNGYATNHGGNNASTAGDACGTSGDNIGNSNATNFLPNGSAPNTSPGTVIPGGAAGQKGYCEYVFPSGASPGDQYCMYIEVTDTPSGNTYDSSKVCATYKAAGNISFTINSSATPGSVNSKGTSGTRIAFSNSATYTGTEPTDSYTWEVMGSYSPSNNGYANTHGGFNASTASNACGASGDNIGNSNATNFMPNGTANNTPTGTTIPGGASGQKGYCVYKFPSNAASGATYCTYLQVTDTKTGKTFDDSANAACVTYSNSVGVPTGYPDVCKGQITFNLPGSDSGYNDYTQAFFGIEGQQSGTPLSVTDSIPSDEVGYAQPASGSVYDPNPSTTANPAIVAPYTYKFLSDPDGYDQTITITYAAGSTMSYTLLIRGITDTVTTTTSRNGVVTTHNSYAYTPYPGYPFYYANQSCDTAPTATITGGCDELSYTFDDTDDSSAAVAIISVNGSTIANGTITGGGSGNVDTPTNYEGFQPTTYTITVPDILSNGASGGLPAATDSVTQTCLPPMQCGNLTPTDGTEEAGTPFHLRFGVLYQLGSNGSPPNQSPDVSPYNNMTMGISSSLPGGSGSVSPTITNSSTNSSATGTVDIGASSSVGTYTVNWSLDDNNGNPVINCSNTLTLHNYPYVNFFGGDLTAGGGFGTSACNSSGNIYTYLDTSTAGSAKGSSSQFGVGALGVIEGLRSDSLNSTASSTSSYSNLTFANTSSNTASPSALYGGSYGVSNNCVPDYSADEPTSTSTFGGSLPSAAGTYALTAGATGAVTPIGALNVANGVNATIYVTGDVYLTGNITYSGASTWAHVADIPSLFIVATGNIFIAPNVTQLDGVYVSEPASGSGGTINTCANSTGAVQTTDPNFFTTCQNQLTVNGAFVAQNIFLDRTYSSLRYSVSGENPQGAARSCGATGTDVPNGSPEEPDCAAEIFNFSPEIYLSKPASIPTSGPTSTKFDYVTTLPPVL
ncbi:unnamed protein product [Sphagnum balticum]